MALTKNVIPMSFSQGIQTSEDPKQIAPGKLLLLHNSRFQRTKSLIKRFGYAPVSKEISTGGNLSSGISCFGYKQESLIQDSSSLYAYSDLNKWTKRADLKNFDFSTQEVKSDGVSKTNCVASYDPITGIEIYVYSNATGLYFTAIERETKTIIYDDILLDSVTVSQIQIQYVNSKWLIIYSNATTSLYYIVKDPTNLTNSVTPTTILTTLTTGQCFDSTVLGTNTFLAVHKTSSEINVYRFDSSFTLLLRKALVGPLDTSTVGIAAYSTTRILVMYSISPGTAVKVYDDTNPTASPAEITLSTRTAYTISAVFDVSGNAQVFYFNYFDLAFASDKNKMFTVSFSNANAPGINNEISAGVLFVSKVFLKGTTCLFYACPMSSSRQNQNLNTLITTDQQGLYLCGVEFGGSEMKVHQKSNSGTFGFTQATIRALPEVSRFTENTIDRFIFAFLKKTKVTVSNSLISYINGVSSIDSFESTKAAQRIYIGETLMICAGQTYGYDGLNLVESGFNIYPSIDPSYAINSQGGGLGTYGVTPQAIVQYVATYEWTDQNGNLQRSAPSDPVQVQLADSVEPSGNFSGYWLNGAAVGLPVNRSFDIRSPGGLNGLVVGDFVVSAVAYPAGTFVETIYPAGVIGINPVVVFTTTTGAGPGTYSFTKPSPGLYSVGVTSGSDIISYGTPGVFHIGQRFYKATAAPAGFTDGSTIIRDYGNGLYQISAAATATATTSIWSKDATSVTASVRNTSLTDKENVSVVLWRTKVNGSIFYRVNNSATPNFNNKLQFQQDIEDTYSDDELDGNEQLYTSGGEVENIAPPAFSIIQTFKNRLIGVTKDDENQVFYSKQVLDGYGVEFNDSFVINVSSTGGKVTGLGIIDEKLISMKKDKIYYLLGEGPNPMGLQNDFTPFNPISADAGCQEENKMSFVNIPEGIIFKTEKGFYLLNRSIALEFIGDAVLGYNSFNVVSAKILQDVKEARFGLSNGDTLVYDYYHKQWSVDVNNGDSITHVDAEIIDGKYNILNSAGVLKKENSGYADYKTVTGVQTACYIPMELDTGWLSFVGIEAFQRLYKAILMGDYKSDHLLTVQVYYDFDESYFDTIAINNVGAAVNVFNYRLFMPRQKCTAIKFKIKESQYLTVIGEGLNLSTISFEVGVKKGLNKIKAANSFG